jgi:TetR/AcrR family transcriptional repressor of mexJK operon
MEEIAELAGITKRTVYNNYADKETLFTHIVLDVIAYAEVFARGLRAEFSTGMAAAELRPALHDLGRRLALAIVRPEVIARRRLLIGEARAFPNLAREYFDRAPGQVIAALAAGFEALGRARLLCAMDPRRAAEQFAYLVAGEPLDHAMLVGTAPPKEHLIACAREGVETFLARYGTEPGGSGRKRRHAR